MAPAATAKKRIGITIGDCNGIGPELILRTLNAPNITRDLELIIYGSSKVFQFYSDLLRLPELEFTSIEDPGSVNGPSIYLIECLEEEAAIQPGSASKFSATLAKNALERSAEHLKE